MSSDKAQYTILGLCSHSNHIKRMSSLVRDMSGLHYTIFMKWPNSIGVLSQATKNKTYNPKNICSSANKDRSHEEYLV